MTESNRYVNGLRKRTLPTHSEDGRQLRTKAEIVYDTTARDAAGKIHTKTHGTRKEADAWLNKARADRDQGVVLVSTKRGNALDDYWPEHFEKRKIGSRNVRSKKLAARTIDLYEDIYHRHISPTFGRKALNRITTDSVRAWRAGIAEQHPPTAAKAFRLLSSILAAAVDDNRLTKNPCTPIKGGGAEPKVDRPLVETEDVHALATALPEHLRAMVLIAGFLGLRRGELLALKRHHYDQLNQRVHVTEAVTIVATTGRRLSVEPKAESTRWIPLPDDLAVIVDEHLTNFVGPKGDSFLFVGEQGGPLSITSWTKAWKKARAAVGLPKIHLHDLRHHAGTMNASHGAALKENMARLGHATPDASLRYQKDSERRQTELSDRLNEVFRTSQQDNRRANVTRLRPTSDGL
jgi:integrase